MDTHPDQSYRALETTLARRSGCHILRTVVAIASLLLLTSSTHLYSQNTPDSTFADTVQTRPIVDTIGSDSIEVTRGEGSFMERIMYGAADSGWISLIEDKAYLYGDAFVEMGEDKLEAAYIEYDLNTREVFARAEYDSATRRWLGVPFLQYAGEELSALTMKYNFQTGRGVSTAGETVIEDGYFEYDSLKRVSDNVIFALNGEYTTCNAPHRHYYFKAEKMKLITDDKIFADRLQLHIQDVPIITLPVGVYFQLGGGRQSGLIIPNFNWTTARGFEMQRLGYFFAVNDYIDVKLLSDLTSKGNVNVTTETRFRLRDKIQRSDLNLTYGRSRLNVDEDFVDNYIVSYAHEQRLGTETSIGGNLRYESQDALRNTSSQTSSIDSLDKITQRNSTSNVRLSSIVRPFGFDIPWSVGYDRTQDIVTREIKPETWRVSANPQNVTPFAGSGPDLLRSLSFGIQPRYVRQFRRIDTDTAIDGFEDVTTKQGVNLAPSFRLTPRFGYFTVSPTVGLSSSLFFRRMKLESNGSEIDTVVEKSWHMPVWYDFGLSVNTTLYGIIQPGIFGINAIRHRIEPRIGLSFSPDFSDPSYGYYDTYVDTGGETRTYSVFQLDNGVAPIPSAGERRNVNWSVDNSFEAKIDQGDTVEDRKITLLNVSLRGSYNFADSLFPVSPISVTASSSLGNVGRFSASAVLDPYDVGGEGTKVPGGMKFPWVRPTNVSFDLSTSFSSSGFTTGAAPQPAVAGDSVDTRRVRHAETVPQFQRGVFYGERVRGVTDYSIPWDGSMNVNYTRRDPGGSDPTENLSVNVSGSFKLTPTTRIRGGLSYDVIEGEARLPSFTLDKDLHDWDLKLTWRPAGSFSGVYLSIGFKNPMLSSLKQDLTF